MNFAKKSIGFIRCPVGQLVMAAIGVLCFAACVVGGVSGPLIGVLIGITACLIVSIAMRQYHAYHCALAAVATLVVELAEVAEKTTDHAGEKEWLYLSGLVRGAHFAFELNRRVYSQVASCPPEPKLLDLSQKLLDMATSIEVEVVKVTGMNYQYINTTLKQEVGKPRHECTK